MSADIPRPNTHTEQLTGFVESANQAAYYIDKLLGAVDEHRLPRYGDRWQLSAALREVRDFDDWAGKLPADRTWQSLVAAIAQRTSYRVELPSDPRIMPSWSTTWHTLVLDQLEAISHLVRVIRVERPRPRHALRGLLATLYPIVGAKDEILAGLLRERQMIPVAEIPTAVPAAATPASPTENDKPSNDQVLEICRRLGVDPDSPQPSSRFAPFVTAALLRQYKGEPGGLTDCGVDPVTTCNLFYPREVIRRWYPRFIEKRPMPSASLSRSA